MKAGQGAALILVTGGLSLLLLPRPRARVAVQSVEYPGELTCTQAFTASFELSNRGRKPVEVSASVRFGSLDGAQEFVRLTAARTLPAGPADGVPESVGFSPYDFDRASWPLGGYRLSIEVFKGTHRVSVWEAPEATAVV